MSPISQATLAPILSTILPKIKTHLSTKQTPYILAITGPQGSGKTTWAHSLQSTLSKDHGLNTITLSLDDLYYDHTNLVRVRNENPENKLLRTRGQPGTHDEALGKEFFSSLRSSGDGHTEVAVPAFDKSQFGGEGDRVPREDWQRIKAGEKIEVCIFEGWCVGFRSRPASQVENAWRDAKDHAGKRMKHGSGLDLLVTTLPEHRLEDLLSLNENLRRYNESFMGPEHFDFLLHLDAADLLNVYAWRVEAERKMILEKGMGMSDEELIRFVEGYMPGYELYLDGLRQRPYFEGIGESEGATKQTRVVLDTDRTVRQVAGFV